ncbi:Scr1 family TA system antitoxin-like transcriptional regulator [Streptomyces sp. NPDC093108]|uniref:Scr1 family TA system antitoxin-like transcriptional regulator n=1 Tax=Streptomyces sp. NPDC093108 TaxID=3366030 RepID=UPI00380B927A
MLDPTDHSHTSRPAVSRICNLLTEGKDSYESDQVLVAELLAVAPWLPDSMKINQSHRPKAVLTLAQLEIEQFIDLGCGYPSITRGGRYVPAHTFDVAHSVHPLPRVLYVDDDPYVFAHAKMALDEAPGTCAVLADIRDVPGLLASADVYEHLDLTQPVGVLLNGGLSWMTDAAARKVLQDLWDLLPAGSAVAVTHVTSDDDPAAMAALAELYERAGIVFRPRSLDEIQELLGPWALLPPGIAPVARWRRDDPPHVPGHLGPAWTRPPNEQYSHAYAAVTAPKPSGPAPPTVAGILAREPARGPGQLLVGASLTALREHRGLPVQQLAAKEAKSPLAISLWEAGSRVADNLWFFRSLIPAGHDLTGALKELLPGKDFPDRHDQVTDTYPGNGSRAAAVLRAATAVRAVVLSRLPESLQTPEYAALLPAGSLTGALPGLMPPVPAPCPQDTTATWDLVLDQAVLHRHCGNPRVLAAQLDHVLSLAALHHVTVRVLPLDAPLTMPVTDIVEHTLPGGTLWRTDGFRYTGREQYRALINQAVGHAAPPEKSLALIRQARDRLHAHAMN